MKRVVQSVFGHFMGSGPPLSAAFPLSFDLMSPPRLALLECLEGSLAAAEGDHIVDVGGNIGTLLAGMLSQRPGARGTIYEQPGLLERATAFLQAQVCAHKIYRSCPVVPAMNSTKRLPGYPRFLMKFQHPETRQPHGRPPFPLRDDVEIAAICNHGVKLFESFRDRLVAGRG